MREPEISFDNTENAFAYKTDGALKKADFLFSSMGHAWLVRLGTWLTPRIIRMGLPVKTLIRNTIFAQFVGGETLEQTAVVAENLGRYGVQVILDYGVEGGDEGEDGFNKACDEFIRVIGYAGGKTNIPFISIKVTGIARFGLLEKLDHSTSNGQSGSLMKRFARALGALSAEETAEWQRVEQRMMKICQAAADAKIGVLVDAEETWIQDPVDVLTILMMERYNRNRLTVYNTIQLYRWDRLGFLTDCYEAALQRDFVLGVKLVRGAYMEKERKRAAVMGYASPIQADKEATDRDYNTGLEFCIRRADRIATIVATHNEASNYHAVRLIREGNLALDHPYIHFSQLYGMSDNITFNLAKAGCAVSKYLPYGPIRDVIPYLMRRAQENSSVSGQMGRELGLIKKELQRRRIGVLSR